MTELNLHVNETVDFLVGLLNIHSPTGYHIEAIDYVKRAFEVLQIPGLSLSVTTKGALLAVWKGKSSSAPRGITAHVDTLGLMVREIKSSGRLKTVQINGIMWGGIEMEGVTVRTHDNRRYRGTVVPVNASLHVNKEIHTSPRNADTMEIRLDVKTRSAEETRALGIDIGDFIFLDPRVEVTDTGFVRGRFLDDKAGVAVIYGAMLALKAANLQPAQDIAILIANYEEVGHGGSSGWPFTMTELLSIDMGAIGEGQNSDEYSVSICVKDTTGPYHFDMNNKLRRLSTQYNIQHKVDIYPFYGSDGSAYWRAGGDAKVGLIGPGVDCSHAYERTHRDSLEHSAHLIARYFLDEL